jgi:FkbM family methyltransferase
MSMDLPFKVRFLNFFRTVFKIPTLEGALASLTAGSRPDSFFSKLVPNSYQYKRETIRTIERNNIIMKVDIGDYVGHYLYFGFEDSGMQKLFELCPKGANVLDVGTNIGWTLMNLAKKSESGRVFGFEPDPVNHRRCAENLSLNSMSNVTLFEFGLSDVNARMGIEVRTPSNRGGNRIAKPVENELTVEVMRLDDLEFVKTIDRIDLIKIDVEGYEVNVLKGARSVLIKHHPALFIEVDDNNLRQLGYSAAELLTFLTEVGYKNFVTAYDGVAVTPSDNFNNCHFDVIAR